MEKDLRIVYLGTPDFAVTSLKALVEHGYNVVGVVTMPDKPAGRGQKVKHSPVKTYALEKEIPILQPTNLKDENFLLELKKWEADIQVVVAFRMLPESVWNMPPMGTINVHASLLPEYRGAAPINRAIMNGEKETGVSTFKLQHAIDTGGIILQKKISISPNDHAGIMHDKLMVLGAEALIETLKLYQEGQAKEKAQDNFYKKETDLKKAPKIFKEDCIIDWNQPAQSIFNHVRGLCPYPAAFTTFNPISQKLKGYPKKAKIFSVEVLETPSTQDPGTLETDGKSYLYVHTVDFKVSILSIQLEGKKRNYIEEFLRGFRNEVTFKLI